MVWDIQLEQARRENTLQEHLLRELTHVAAEEPADVEERLTAVSQGVAAYCADRAERGMPSRELHLFLSRALWGVGETHLAHRLVSNQMEPHSIKQTLLELLPYREISPLLWEGVARGVVRCSTGWISTKQQALWVLDLSRIEHWRETLALARWLTVRTMILAMAPLWDTARGNGALGVSVDAGSGDERQRSTQSQMDDVLDLCQTVLDRERKRRDWHDTPCVLRMR